MELLLDIIRVLVIIFIVLFLLSLVVYFFNLDMKMSSKMQPILNKWYDRYKRSPLP